MILSRLIVILCMACVWFVPISLIFLEWSVDDVMIRVVIPFLVLVVFGLLYVMHYMENLERQNEELQGALDDIKEFHNLDGGWH